MTVNTASPLAVDALVFDAYGTLFDVHSVEATAERMFPGQGAALSQLWRTKQLEYTWLQSLMLGAQQRREDFAALTAHALDFAAEKLHLPLAPTARQRLLDEYLDLKPFPDAMPALLRLASLPRVVLSNGTHAMLETLVKATGFAPHLDAILSVDAVEIYKPSPRVYQLAVDYFKLPPMRIGFVSSNGWDVAGGKAFGFTAIWVNRAQAPVERHGPRPDAILTSLDELPSLLGKG